MWHCDNEPLFGKCGEAKLIVSVSFGTLHFSNGRACPVRIMKLICAVLAMVTFLSWMAIISTRIFIVRVPVWNRNGSTLRSVGSNNMLPPVLCFGQEWHVVCQRVRRVHQFLLWGTLGLGVFLSFLASPSVSCVYGRCQLLQVYHLLCTRLGLHWCASCRTLPVGRWSVGCITFVTSGENAYWAAHKNCL